MAVSTQTFRALITADSDGAVKELKQFEKQADNAGDAATSSSKRAKAAFGGMATAAKAVGAAAIIGIGKNAVDAASELEESTNAVRQAFGGAADGVLEFGQNSADAYGLSKRAFNEMALGLSGFADELSQGGAGSPAEVIDDLIGRATDFGSVWNKETDEVANAFRSFLSGESEPMKQFGVVINAAAVSTRALEMGLADTTSELTEQDKMLARYNLLMEETAYTAGDWARTSDGLAGSQKKLTANLEDSAAKLGEKLLPAATEATAALADITSALTEMPDVAADFAIGAGLVAAGLLTIGKNATLAGANILAAYGAYKGIEAGIKGDESFAVGDVPFYQKPFQFGAKMGLALRGDLDQAEANYELVQSFNAAEAAAASFDRTQLVSLTTFEEVHQAVLDQTGSLHAANTVAVEWTKTQDTAAAATEDHTDKVTDFDRWLETATQDGEKYANIAEAKARRDEEAAAAAEEHRQAIADLVAEVNDAIDSTFDYERGNIAMAEAMMDFADQQAESTRVLNDSESSTRDKERALYDLRTAELDAADEAWQLAQAFAEEQGAAEGSAEAADYQREKLQELQDKFPALRDEIQLFIDKLNQIPTSRTVNVGVNYSGGGYVSSGTRGGGKTQNVVSADGAVINRPTLTWVGEAGETEYIIPSSKLPGNGPMPNLSGMGGGLSIGSIQVVAPAGADADEFGRKVREAIVREVRWNGPVDGWAA